MRVCADVYVHVCVRVLREYTCVCKIVRVDVCVRECAYLHVCTCARECTWMCVNVLYVYVSVYVVGVYLCVCIFECVCVNVYVRMYRVVV